MATLNAICDGIETRLATIATLRAYSEEPDSIEVAQGKAVAYPVPVEGEQDTYDGTERTALNVVILVASAQSVNRARAIRMVSPYISRGDASDVKTAIENDGTLGGVVDTLKVGRWHRFGLIEVAGVDYWGVMREVEVYH